MSDTPTVSEVLESFGKRELGDVKILMVEDDLFLSELILTKLSQHGCIPYATPSGEEALVLAEQYLPDVVILDLMLPGLSGEEVLIKMKANATLKDIPVIIFSNKSGEDDIKNNLKNGAAEYLVKSATDLSDLPKIIIKVLGR